MSKSKRKNRKKRREQLQKEYLVKKQYRSEGKVVIEKIVSDNSINNKEVIDANNHEVYGKKEEIPKENQGGFKETVIKIENNSDIKTTTYGKKIEPFIRKHKEIIKEKMSPYIDKVKDKVKPVKDKVDTVTAPVLYGLAKVFSPVKKRADIVWNSKRCIIVRRKTYRYYRKFSTKAGDFYIWTINNPVKAILLLAFFSLMFVESMSRKSLSDAIIFMAEKPAIFFLNYLIVLAPFMLALVIKRKLAVYIFFSVLWVLIGVIDFMLLMHRTTPFTGVDLKIDKNEITVIFNYLNKLQSVLLVVSIIGTIIALIIVLIFTKKIETKGNRLKSSIVVIMSWIIIYYSVIFGINTGILSTKFGNLLISYHDYGMPYCFIVTIVDTGIAKPQDYSEEKMDNLVSAEETMKPVESTKETKNIDELPNIIFIQLESFIDPTLIKNGITFSEDPMPFYRSLREKYSSGNLTVPTVVAGTCNTEFEVITGMSLGFFGPGEYPYKTILKETTCESMAFDLKPIGYKAHAIHNHTSGFYGRNVIYSHFGFDTFTGIEMMHDTSKTANNSWTKDDILTGCILDCLNSSEEKDLIYTISVQSHGTYNADLPPEEQFIEVSGLEDEELLHSYNYYINQVKQVDNFVKDLVNNLSQLDEDVVLVMYGDHIPGLSISNEMFENKTIYETEYVIWDNIGMEKKDMNLTSYQLAAEVFERLGIYEGTVFKYHQETDHESEDYMSGLEYLQYDMLYGQNYVYGGNNPYEPSDIRYGVKDIVIDKATYDGEYLYIAAKDKAFSSKYSKVFINGNRIDDSDTEVIFSDFIKARVPDEEINDGTIINVKQINASDVEFHCSEDYVFTIDDNSYLPEDDNKTNINKKDNKNK